AGVEGEEPVDVQAEDRRPIGEAGEDLPVGVGRRPEPALPVGVGADGRLHWTGRALTVVFGGLSAHEPAHRDGTVLTGYGMYPLLQPASDECLLCQSGASESRHHGEEGNY